MNKIKMKPKKTNRTNVNNKFALTPSAQGEISRSVLYSIKLKKLIRFLTDYGEKALDYQRLSAITDAIEKIVNKNNEIKKQNQQQKYTIIGGYNGQSK